jgi:hypothetical protein
MNPFNGMTPSQHLELLQTYEDDVVVAQQELGKDEYTSVTSATSTPNRYFVSRMDRRERVLFQLSVGYGDMHELLMQEYYNDSGYCGVASEEPAVEQIGEIYERREQLALHTLIDRVQIKYRSILNDLAEQYGHIVPTFEYPDKVLAVTYSTALKEGLITEDDGTESARGSDLVSRPKLNS